jgi:predicted NAD/FAD-binding protein
MTGPKPSTNGLHRRAQKLDDRIAIVGAGPSGLVIAADLKKRGFSNVILFEREPQVGGKVATEWVDNRPIELGAIWVLDTYRNARSLIKHFGFKLDRIPNAIFIQSKQGQAQPVWHALRERCGGRIAALAQLRRMLRIARPIARKPGLAHVGSDFSQPFGDFARQHRFFEAADTLRPYALACGYAYYETTPAAYYLKHIPQNITPYYRRFLAAPANRSRNIGMMVREGYRSVWQEIVRNLKLDVRLGMKLQRVEPAAGTKNVALQFENGLSEEFDYVFVATTVGCWPKVLPPPLVRERRLLQVKSIAYRSVIAEVKGLPHEWAHFYEAGCYPKSEPGLIIANNTHRSHDLYVMYQVLHDGCSIEQADFKLRADLAAAGATKISLVAERNYPDHFPHVSPPDFAAGFHANLEAHQGRHGVFLAGSPLNG